jgi:hypothetical protein
LTVTHPFHPLCGQRLVVLGTRWFAGRLTFFCDAAGHRISLPQDWTDRGPEPEALTVSLETLVALRALVDDLARRCPPRRAGRRS